MSNIKSLNRLSEFVGEDALLVKMVEAVEREVSERYMELPVDADGVPIRVGDVIESDCEIPSRVTGVEFVWSVEDEPGWNLYWGDVMRYGSEDTDWGVFPDRPSTYRHYKPRTIEDVLADFANEVAKQGHQIGLTGHELAMRYAAEIREMMGGLE